MRVVLALLLVFGLSSAPAGAAVSPALGALAQRVAMCSSSPTRLRLYIGIIAVESAGHPYAIGDNATPHRSYFFRTREEAVAAANDLYARGHHSLDVGIGQVDTINFPGYGLDFARAFDVCENIRVGTSIFNRAFAATPSWMSMPQRLELALAHYNGCDCSAGHDYASRVWAVAASLPRELDAAHFTPRLARAY